MAMQIKFIVVVVVVVVVDVVVVVVVVVVINWQPLAQQIQLNYIWLI